MDLFAYLLGQLNGGGGGGSGSVVQYKTIEYLDANTIQLIENTKEGDKIHIINLVYAEDGRIESIKIDNRNIPLQYDGKKLLKIGKTNINLDKVPSSKKNYETVYVNATKQPPIENTDDAMSDISMNLIGGQTNGNS